MHSYLLIWLLYLFHPARSDCANVTNVIANSTAVRCSHEFSVPACGWLAGNGTSFSITSTNGSFGVYTCVCTDRSQNIYTWPGRENQSCPVPPSSANSPGTFVGRNCSVTLLQCKAPVYCELPSGITDPSKSNASSCTSNGSLLASLGIYNVVGAAISLIFGHQAVRDRIPVLLCFKTDSDDWTPWAGILSFVMQATTMLISAAIARTGGFHASFTALLGLWTTRPRIAFATLIWHFGMFTGIFVWSGSSRSQREAEEAPLTQKLRKLYRRRSKKKTLHYKRTYRDILLAENLLNILSFPFALNFLRDKDVHTGPVCGNPNVDIQPVASFYRAMGWNLVAGGASAFVLCFQIIHYVQYGGEIKRDGGRVVSIAGPILMFGTLVSNWVLWSSFIATAGSYFCPGGVISTGVVWGIALLMNGLVRPMVGSSGYS